ncbi:hypothetical protein [Pontibacillus yanchengensis]|uniref:hypothetical protein n=1 Tax=Pontibacillus yanchengensis TaxID=462910 RepID=UPI00136DAC48|nr:hypothetical protein [Pontibacillus yanchengensis]
MAYYLKLVKLKKEPKGFVAEIDERLVSQKNEADAKTLKLLQGGLFLLYLAYTFILPEEVFKSIGWRGTLSTLLFALFAQAFFRYITSRSNHIET